jgi:amino acid permease
LQHEDGLSATGGSLAIVSTIIGGGIVGLPYAMLTLGMVVGVLLNLSVCYVTFLSGILYLSLRELIPGRPNSLYEIGYML